MRDLNLFDLFRRNAALYGNRPALVDEKGTLNFRDLRQRVARMAAALTLKGIHPGDRVAVLAYNSRRYFYLLGATARLGAILVPLNWRLSEEELLFILKDAEPGLLFHDTPHAPMVTQLAQRYDRAMETVDLETMATPTDDPAADAAKPSPQPADGDTPFCIIYTAAMGGTPPRRGPEPRQLYFQQPADHCHPQAGPS